MKRGQKTEPGPSFTWEEVSWITGIPIQFLLEIFAQRLQAKEIQAGELPASLDVETLTHWLRTNPGLIREVA